MKKQFILWILLFFVKGVHGQSLTIKNYTNCDFNQIQIALLANDVNNSSCTAYIYNFPSLAAATSYVAYPNNLTGTPSTILWTDPTAPSPWFVTSTMAAYTMLPANSPQWTLLSFNPAGNTLCSGGYLRLSCVSSPATGQLANLCFPSPCSSTSNVRFTTSVVSGNYLLVIEEI